MTMTQKIILLLVLLALPWSGAVAQKTYKWVDSQGNVSYHDRPPSIGSGYQVEEKNVGSKRGGGDVTDTQKAPVVLYVVPKCSSCESARNYLQKRNVPFAEKNVESDVKLQEELRAKSGGLSVPTIIVGTKVMNGYLESLLAGELDQAGYPNSDTDKTDKAGKPADDEGFKAPTQ